MANRTGYGVRAPASKARHGFAVLLAVAFGAPAAADPVDVLALGDSLTQGYGLPEQDGFVPQLQKWLDERGYEVRVINAGVSGDTSAGGLARVDWSLTPEIDGMIVALGGNDVLRGIDPATTRANLRGILEAGRARDLPTMLVGLEAPGNYGPDYKAAFDAMYPELAAQFDAIHVESFFEGIREEGDSLSGAARFMQPDGIHPNAEGVARIVDAIGPAVASLVERAQGSGAD